MIDYTALIGSWRQRLAVELRSFTSDAVQAVVGAVLQAGCGSIYDERPERGDGHEAAGCCPECAAEVDPTAEGAEAPDDFAATAAGAARGHRGRRGGRRHRRRQDGAAEVAPDAGDEGSEPVAG